MAEVEAPVVICILDRSVADETAAEMVVQLRNSRGEPISLDEDSVASAGRDRSPRLHGGAMSRIGASTSATPPRPLLARSGVEIVAVGDPAGARFNAAVRRLMAALRDDGPGLWDDLVGASKALRWRLITQPQPIEFNPGLVQLAGEVTSCPPPPWAVADQALLDELAASATALARRTEISRWYRAAPSLSRSWCRRLRRDRCQQARPSRTRVMAAGARCPGADGRRT